MKDGDRVVVMDRWMKSRVEREGVVGPQNIVIVPHRNPPEEPSFRGFAIQPQGMSRHFTKHVIGLSSDRPKPLSTPAGDDGDEGTRG